MILQFSASVNSITFVPVCSRTLPGVLVQDIKIHNPGQRPAQLGSQAYNLVLSSVLIFLILLVLMNWLHFSPDFPKFILVIILVVPVPAVLLLFFLVPPKPTFNLVFEVDGYNTD